MKKRIYSLVLALVLLLSLCPVAALAEETEEYTGEPVATSEPLEAEPIAEPVAEPTPEPEVTPEPEPATEPEATETPVEQPEATEAPAEPEPEPTAEPEATEAPVEDPEPETDDAAAAVEMMIDALPELSALDTMAADERDAAYFAAQDAADAYYALSDEQQARVANLDALIALLDWFSAQVEAMNEHDYDDNGFCTIHENCYQPATLNEDYYQIGNAGQLYWFAQLVNEESHTNDNGKLVNNITVNQNVLVNGELNSETSTLRSWTPIASFRGSFDGAGYTISGLYCEGSDYLGLFAEIAYDSENNTSVKNVTVKDSYFKGSGHIGAIAGACVTTEAIVISNCHNSNTVVIGTSNNVGGVVGSCNSSITGCTNSGSVSAASNVGGVVGDVGKSDVSVTKCSNSGTVTCSGASSVGGVVGCMDTGITVQYCYNTGAVTSTAVGTGTAYVGGVVGSVKGSGRVESCYNTGKVSGDLEKYFGGVAGYKYSDATVTNCYYQSDMAEHLYGYNENKETKYCDDNAMTASQFKSGELAYKLNDGNTTDPVWRQTCGEGYPEISRDSGKIVYQSAPCPSYSNEAGITKAHEIEDYTCEYCGTAMAASVTNNNTVTYYEDLKAAFGAVPDSGAVTVTLLSDINQDNWSGAQEDGTGQRQINNGRTFTLDLNGKTIAVKFGSDDVSLCDATLTIKDSSDGNGKIEDILCVDDPASLTVQSGAFAGLRACGGAVVLQGGGYGQILFGTGDSRTIGDLLGNGYGYYYTNKPSTGGRIWLTGLTDTSCRNVAVAALPITGVTLTSDKADNTLTYGETVTLTATVSLASGYVSDRVTYSWCEVVSGVEKGIQGQQGYSYSPTSPSAGNHTYRVKATVDGYTVNGDITVTVNKASVTVTQAPAAEENLTYNGTAQALVTGGTATGGSIEYSLDQTNWSDSVPTGKDVGQYTVYWREKARDTNHTANTTVNTISVDIAPATLTVSVTIKGKEYDGTTTATADSVTFTGLQNDERLTKDTDYTVSATFEDKNAGKNKTVTATVMLCETATTKNYTLTGNTATTTANIAQKPIDVTVSVADKTYDGTNTATVTAEVDAKNLISGDSVTIAGVTGTFDNVNAGGDKSVTIHTDGKQVSGTGSANYDLKFPATATGRINKAEMSVENPPTAGTIEKYNAEEQALVTAGVSANGTVYYSLDKKMWTYSVPTAKDAGEYTVYWYIQDTSGNYKDYGSKNEPKELSVTIAPRDINPPEAAVSPYIACEQDGTLTFNGKKQTPTFKLELKPRKEHGTSGVVDDALLETLVEGKDYTVDVAAQSNVGTYTATITGTGNYTGTLTREWSIGKAAAPTLDDVTAKHLYTAEGEATVSLKKILADGNVSAYTPGSLPQGVTNVSVDSDGTLHYTISGLTEADVDKTFTIPVTIQSQNYEDATVNVVVKVTKPSAIANLVQQVAGNAPHTGDSAMPVLYIVVIVLALGAIVALVVVRRKKK